MLDVSVENLPEKAPGPALALPARASVVLRSVFQTLAYADVFDYPLTADEVYRYLPATASLEDVTQALTNELLFSKVEDFYTLHGREEIVATRRRRAQVARPLWRKAARYGRIIASLPFVRMLAVTGSLAVNNAD